MGIQFPTFKIQFQDPVPIQFLGLNADSDLGFSFSILGLRADLVVGIKARYPSLDRANNNLRGQLLQIPSKEITGD